jgi:hypothetical protein
MNHYMPTVFAVVVSVLLASIATAQACSKTSKYFGMCDASAAVAIGRNMFVVANDEDNVLRVDRNDQAASPIYSLDLTDFLKVDPKHPEADIEGATRVGKRIYWITSHGRNKEGKVRTSRRRLFATEFKADGDKVIISPLGDALRRNAWSLRFVFIPSVSERRTSHECRHL